ncbi:MAG: SDR family oxidoreductase [Candidatus Omnitrophica bacterium]|nr:SDR family oxidoreductase [Candidatus Omnitrophota bacterium]
MARYLVTGGAGFIGSNIVEELVRRKANVRVLDSFITGKMENLRPFMGSIELVRGDIRDKKALGVALKGIDFVIHQAALRSVPKSVDDPFTTNDINVFGTLNLLMACKKAKVKRVVYASSSSVYGDVKTFPQRETDLTSPISPYGVSKLAAENYCITFARTFGLETVSLRYFNVFGPRQNPESKYSAVIPIFIYRMMGGKSPAVEWDGKQSRDFTYVANVVEANLSACVAPKISGEVINVACGTTVSVLKIVRELNDIFGTDIKPKYLNKRAGDVRKTYADITKMKSLLRLKKIVPFNEGLRLTIDWFLRSKRTG